MQFGFRPFESAPALQELRGHVRGFCTQKDYRAALMTYGLSERHIFQRGAGAEDLDPCLATFRGRPGWLVMAQDLRAFGGTKRLVAARVDELERAKIRVLDLSHPEHQTYSAQMQHAHILISGSRFQGDRRRARRQGRDGGLGRGRAANERRNALLHQDIVRRICSAPELTWKRRVEVMGGPPFSESTLRRLYITAPSARRG